MSNDYQEYWSTVRAIAEDIRDWWIEDNDTDVHQAVHESVDGCHYIIYYSENLTVLQHSSNSDAIDDQGLGVDTSRGWQFILTQVAFYAMEQDVYDELGNLGWDGATFEIEDVEDVEDEVCND